MPSPSAIRAYMRYFGSKAAVHVHVAKSWLVAMGRPMIVT
jgi:hypothetical protein